MKGERQYGLKALALLVGLALALGMGLPEAVTGEGEDLEMLRRELKFMKDILEDPDSARAKETLDKCEKFLADDSWRRVHSLRRARDNEKKQIQFLELTIEQYKNDLEGAEARAAEYREQLDDAEIRYLELKQKCSRENVKACREAKSLFLGKVVPLRRKNEKEVKEVDALRGHLKSLKGELGNRQATVENFNFNLEESYLFEEVGASCKRFLAMAKYSRSLNPEETHVRTEGKARLGILEATYGWNCRRFKPWAGRANTVSRGNVTDKIRSKCRVAPCRYTVDHEIIGDPAYGCEKDYEVKYRCGSSRTVHSRSLDAEAGRGDKSVLLSCPRPK